MSVAIPDTPSPSSRIRRLPEQLANQIAAGEVVERPASVLKELMENALDAGADNLEIELEKGGMRLIRVRDNGTGITAEELPLALLRHATSKIASLEHLLNVQSMGFRGEALASIGSVSRLKLTSRTADAEQAWTVSAEGSEQASAPVPSAFTRGTLLEVAELFYNTPARRRFLKSEQTEYHHLDEVFKRMALSRMDVAMRLKHNQRQIYQLPISRNRLEQERRIAKLCGKAFMQHAHYLEFEHGAYRLSGWMGRADYSRAQGDVQYCFLNHRAIRDKLVNHAIRQAYSEFVPQGRYPAYVLYLELPATQVDVNVHPTKHEVRFHEGRMVHDFLVATLRRALMGEETAATYPEPPGAAGHVYAEEGKIRPYANPVEDESAVLTLLPGAVAWVRYRGQDWLCHCARMLQQHYQQRQQQGDWQVRPLLIPERVQLKQGLERVLEVLARQGIEADAQGPQTLLLRAVPDYFSALNIADLCARLAQVNGIPDSDAFLRLAARCSDYQHPGFVELVQTQLQRHDWTPIEQARVLLPLKDETLQALFQKPAES